MESAPACQEAPFIRSKWQPSCNMPKMRDCSSRFFVGACCCDCGYAFDADVASCVSIAVHNEELRPREIRDVRTGLWALGLLLLFSCGLEFFNSPLRLAPEMSPSAARSAAFAETRSAVREKRSQSQALGKLRTAATVVTASNKLQSAVQGGSSSQRAGTASAPLGAYRQSTTMALDSGSSSSSRYAAPSRGLLAPQQLSASEIAAERFGRSNSFRGELPERPAGRSTLRQAAAGSAAGPITRSVSERRP
eukprot:TRINITY_DN36539_c0_g1_i3.p1 TRINITY_DN36539_c0_g1~~TRINITY_DN36539_c0_g1_i3.p1  ORF type:complete len:250 (-),score=48.68 TRINITY_DN36539_c0_g1_i3:28-777(-)